MAYNPNNPNGQALNVNSAPVTLSSEQQAILSAISSALNDIKTYTDGLEALITTTNSKDFATQTTLALVKTKTDNLDVALSTLAKSSEMTTLNGHLVDLKANTDGIEALITLTNGHVDGLQTELEAISAQDFATEATLATASTTLTNIAGYVDELETTLTALNNKFSALGQNTMANSQPVVIASNQTAIPVSMSAATVAFEGRTATFRTPGRAGTTGQKIMSIHNATDSAVTVSVKKFAVDMYSTVKKDVTVPPPLIRIWKVTVLPTDGTTLTKNKVGGTTTSSASVTVLGDASADGTGSGTTLTATLPAGTIIDEIFASRIITAVGEVNTRLITFDFGDGITLSALEGLVVFLDYTVATMNPVTDMWSARVHWTES